MGEVCSQRECVSIRTTLVRTPPVSQTDLIKGFGCNTVTLPPYSPDITSDYHRFPILKKQLGRTHFTIDEELKEEVLNYLCDAPQLYDLGTKKMVYRMHKFINLNGDYIKKIGKILCFQNMYVLFSANKYVFCCCCSCVKSLGALFYGQAS